MRRFILVAAIIWVIASAALVACVLAGVHDLAHAYLAAWLVLISLPLGALPALMILELWPTLEMELTRSLRVLLASLPFLALLAIPVLLHPGAFYAWAPGSSLPAPQPALEGFARTWFEPLSFALRGAAYLVVWCGLGLFFIWPASPSPARRSLARIGLFLHLFIGTLAAYDWFMSLDGAFISSAYGVIVILVQCAFATTIALFASLALGESVRVERVAVLAVLSLVALATYAQLQQYLVVWSANLPKDIVWYQTRWRDAAGPIFGYGAALLLTFALVTTMPGRLGSRRIPVLAAMLALAFVEVCDLICLASPRATFMVPAILVDVAFIVAIAGLALLCAVLLGGRHAQAVRHG